MRKLAKAAKALVESLFDVRIYSAGPHGRDDCNDIQRTGIPIRMILDVGAHIGESALKFNRAFPDATIHSFEPVAHTFELLRQSVSDHPNIHCHQLAMSDQAGTAAIYLTSYSSSSSLVRPDFSAGEEMVQMTTVDDFTTANALPRIDLLKVDAEGFDLNVLRGASKCLEEGQISFVLAEIGFSPERTAHALFDHVRDFLAARRFSVFGIYDQQLEWSGENRLCYANACFCHEKVVMTKRPVR
jgi:FkbM family methyltransferase